MTNALERIEINGMSVIKIKRILKNHDGFSESEIFHVIKPQPTTLFQIPTAIKERQEVP